ncbi:flagellar biosynthesis protein FlhB [Aneurinibacillus danicus]|uniref:Flagellar biosynthetic protein FlhB n=1 Tax=Aneurinibacillus danicus TaxID=267746 RepID=A0A511V3V6_9BACL|nr:flagellar biosynthesis protein FlhB [Aneurinibacillus danicus]GEN33606.1 flagellar biosynthetic protein FlhB [Aneurinibacillus danicus]
MTQIRFQVDLQFFSGEKTEKATPRKRQKAREEGQVAKSQEVSAALILLAIFLFLLFMGKGMGERLYRYFQSFFTNYLLMDVSEETTEQLMLEMVYQAAIIVWPFFLIAVVIGFFANYIQFGLLFTTKPLVFKLERLDPVKGAKKLFSLQALVNLVKSILKVLFIGTAVWFILWGGKDELLTLATKSVGDMLTVVGKLTLQMGFTVAVLLLILAIFDYMYQKFQHEKQLRMSKQDIKDEYKMIEGDPQIKGKIKQKQREMAMRRMMQEVPNADVVITNPTHFAVAIKYDGTSMQAPTVIAKGQDFVALKIKEIAQNHEIVMVENKPLARMLFAQVEVNQQIPEDLFQAVAEVLAYVYKLKGKI